MTAQQIDETLRQELAVAVKNAIAEFEAGEVLYFRRLYLSCVVHYLNALQSLELIAEPVNQSHLLVEVSRVAQIFRLLTEESRSCVLEERKDLITKLLEGREAAAQLFSYTQRQILPSLRSVQECKTRRKMLRFTLFFLIFVLAIGLAWDFVAHYHRGLSVEYFADTHFGKLVAHDVVYDLKFELSDDLVPNKALPLDSFSIRWSGQIYIPLAGSYTFLVTNDDGARLWIDQQLLIDDWVSHPVRVNKATSKFEAGWHDLKIEYFQDKSTKVMVFRWIPPGGVETLVPYTNLKPGR